MAFCAQTPYKSATATVLSLDEMITITLKKR